jgi:hypothetical protein
MTRLYADFLEAGKLLAQLIGMKNPKVENRKRETPKIGIDYTSFYGTKETYFRFYLRTDCAGSNQDKWETLDISFSFYNDFDLCQLYERKEFNYPEKVNMTELIKEIARKYLELKRNNDLNFLFGDRDIRVRGIVGITNTTLIEFLITLKGYIAWGSDKLLVYRFHHGTGSEELFSYAFFIESRQFIYDYFFWCVFPAFVGMSGGTGHSGLIQAETLLEQAKKILSLKIVDINVDESKFLKFLRGENVDFKTGDDLFDETLENTYVDNRAKTLLKELQICSSGKKMWREYESLIKDVFSYLFVPPLDNPDVHCRTIDGLEIRDLIFSNHAEDGFWKEIKTEYKGSYVVIEVKNKEKPNQRDVLQLSDYLNEKHLGLFGILISRKLNKPLEEKRRELYSNDHKMIVLLDDTDIQNMILKKSANEKPEDIIKRLIDTYRMSFAY